YSNRIAERGVQRAIAKQLRAGSQVAAAVSIQEAPTPPQTIADDLLGYLPGDVVAFYVPGVAVLHQLKLSPFIAYAIGLLMTIMLVVI
ncbi:hypothetical protein ABTM69_20505, partial [Acinetobacter baumannii]